MIKYINLFIVIFNFMLIGPEFITFISGILHWIYNKL